MPDKITPSLTEFRNAMRALSDCPDAAQSDALLKVIQYAAYAAGRSVEEIKPRTFRKRHPFTETTPKGWRLS